MKIMTKLMLVATVAVSGMSAATAANAAVTVYNTSGIFENGVSFSGTFGVDFALSGFDQISAINLTTSNGTNFDQLSSYGYDFPANGMGPYNLQFSASLNLDQFVTLWFQADHTDFKLNSIVSQALSPTSSFIIDGDSYFIASGSLGAAAGAVPETATWGMMIAGFGLMGAAMRTRRRSTKVSFA